MSSSNVYLAPDEIAATVRSIYAIIADIDTDAATNPTAAALHGAYCSWFTVQNKHASDSLFYQTNNTAASGAAFEIGPSPDSKMFPPKPNKYDLREEFIRVQTDSNDFIIEVHWD